MQSLAGVGNSVRGEATAVFTLRVGRRAPSAAQGHTAAPQAQKHTGHSDTRQLTVQTTQHVAQPHAGSTIPCLAKGISSGKFVDLTLADSFESGRKPDATCKFKIDECAGFCERWSTPHLSILAAFCISRWNAEVSCPVATQPVCQIALHLLHLGLCWVLGIFIGRGLGWCLQSLFLLFGLSMRGLIWMDSGAGARVLRVDSSGLFAGAVVRLPEGRMHSLVGMLCVSVVVLVVGPQEVAAVLVRAGDEVVAASAQFFVNSSLAPVLLFRRRTKSVADVLEGTKQLGSLRQGGMRCRGIGRGEEEGGGEEERAVCRQGPWWASWTREDSGARPYTWLRPEFIPPSPYLVLEDPVAQTSRILVEPHLFDAEFLLAWIPLFCSTGHPVVTVDQFLSFVDPFLPQEAELDLPRISGQDLLDTARAENCTAGGLDGWAWKEVKALPLPCCSGLAILLNVVESTGVRPQGLLVLPVV